ncbi:hypothetical protein BW723_06565 [Polaribacter reichenbachii]|uniref:Redox-active disulfide protein 2 n=1 Tax=Polaribacter reichenbachii TaxID=996801 RepID=A0A1B8U661_9FLAO|nr:hypothetical protein [Polaribacter reichenbachii]APZ45975.1 hypothetical protein BW723_06565 [Polaribacter reichenbachii]AUC19837.1 hypothetical protein BTO17_14585 [Polaribacter reichenbachii]OBY67308.1 hypothetical protein LPB301_02925 [Polaribacter reichenbachii]
MASQFSTYTTEELTKKLKTQKRLSIFHFCIIVLLFLVAIYKTYKEGISFSSFLPLFFIPMQIFFTLDIKKLKKEIASRK